MKIKQTIYKQFGKPSGKMGRLAGRIMSFKNTKRATWTLEKLQLKPNDFLLEIGYGPGVTIKKVADKLTLGFVAGIDHSEVMYRQAYKKNIKQIQRIRVKLECGTVRDLKYPGNFFDTIYGSNVHFFWEDPLNEFRQLVRLLKPSGRLIMVFQPRWAKSEDAIKQAAEEIKIQYREAGLTHIEIEFRKMRPVTCIYIGGQKTG